jgi:hypothetical protein
MENNNNLNILKMNFLIILENNNLFVFVNVEADPRLYMVYKVQA